MDLRGRKSINKAVLMWVVVALLLLIMATPALSVIFAAPGSVNTKAIVNKAVKGKKIANGAVNSAKIADGSITNADIAAGAAIAASKINSAGLNADTVDGQDAAAFVTKASPTWNTQTRHYSVPPAAWQTQTATDTVVRSPHAYSTSDWWIVAPVNLPDGAVVTRIDLYFNDTSSAWLFPDLAVGLYQQDYATWTASSLGSVGSSGAGGRGSAFADLSPTVTIANNVNTYYLVAWNTSSAAAIESVVITYTTAQP